MRTLTVKERALLHLFDFQRFADAYDVPVAVTQEGIAEAVGIKVQHASQYLKPLIEEGLVEEDTRHVQGRRRRRKAYFLTPRGRHRTASLRGSLLETEVPFRRPSGRRERLPLAQIYQEHRKGTRLLDLLTELDATGVVAGSPEETPSGAVDFTQEAPPVERFYGRAEELRGVLETLEATPVAVVTGMAGMGKTTLGAKVVQELRGDRSLLWRQVRPWDTSLELAFRVSTFLRALGRTELHGLLAGSGSKELSRVEEALRADLTDLDAVLVLDDAHELSEDAAPFASLLLQVVAGGDGARVLLLSRTVPDFYSRRDVAVEGTVAEIPLGGLDPESSHALLTDAGVDPDRAEALATAAGGNPLFLRLLARGIGGDGDTLQTLETYVAEEIEPALDEGERRCLEAAALYRVPVPDRALLLEAGVRRSTLVGIRRKGLLESQGPGRLAMHDALRAYFDRGLSWERRESLAGKVVSWLREQAVTLAEAGRPEEALPFLGNAASVDPDPDRTRATLEELGRLRRITGDLPGAVRAYRKARSLATQPEGRARCHRLAAFCLQKAGDLEEAKREVDAGLQLLPEGPSNERGWLLYMRAALAYERQDFDRAAGLVEEAWTGLPDRGEDPALRGSLANLRGLLRLDDPHREDPVQADADFRGAAEAFEVAGDRRGLSVAYNNLGLVALHQGRTEDALEALERSAALARELGDLPSLEMALFSKAFCLVHHVGDYEEAESLYQESFRLAKATHQRSKVVWHQWHFAHLYWRQGRYEEARESLAYFLRSSEGMINDETRLQTLSLMARLCVDCGDLAASRAYLHRAEELAEKAPATAALPWSRAVLAAAEGDAKRAEEEYRQALAAATGSETGEILLGFGSFLASAGRTEDARTLLRRVREEYGSAARPLDREAKELLGALEAWGAE